MKAAVAADQVSNQSTGSPSSPASALKAISAKRIKKESELLAKNRPSFVKDFSVDAKKPSLWKVTLLPNSEPFKHGAFCVAVELHPEYPFKPPRVTLLTPIYHPNIDAKGNICVSMLQIDNWKPGTPVHIVLEAVLSLIDCPEPERSLREDVAAQFVNEHPKFVTTALEHIKKSAEKRA